MADPPNFSAAVKIMKSFTHLRVASGYSFKYGTAHADQLVERAAEFEMSALALTDMDTMAGAIRFTKSCEIYGKYNGPSPK